MKKAFFNSFVSIYLVLPLYCETTEIYFQKALNAKKAPEKIHFYSLAIEKDKNSKDAYLNRGMVFYKLKNCVRAIADFDNADMLGCDDKNLYFYRGLCHYKKRMYDNAVSDFSKYINRNDNYFKSYYYRARTLHKLKFNEDALSDFDRAIKLNPKLAYLYHYRAFANIDAKKYDHALADFDKTIKLDPSDPIVRKNRGCFNLRLKKLKSATRDLNYALKLQKSFPSAYICMAGYWWMDKKILSKTLANLELAFKYGFKNIDSLYDMEKEGYYFTGLVDTAAFRNLSDRYFKTEKGVKK